MTSNDIPAGQPALSWREVAVARSLDSARTRAEHRVQRFLDAALELMNESEVGTDFTVQEVVERSGQSLRSFYQYFGGKHELLLALFEESVRAAAEHLRERVDREADPYARLRCFVVEYYRLCRPVVQTDKADKRRPRLAMAQFAHHLLTTQPAQASRAFVPVVALFDGILTDAVTAGVLRPDITPRRVTGVVLEAIMFHTFSTTIAGALDGRDGDDAAEDLWRLLMHGIGEGVT